MDAYRLLKFLHLAAVTLWVGGAFSSSLLIFRLARASERALLAAALRHVGFYGRAVVGGASLLTLLSGLGMLAVLGLRPDQTPWVQWGFVGIVGHFVLGAFFIRRATQHLANLAMRMDASAASIRTASRRLTVLNALYLSLLLSVVGVMALKPSF
jgi:uncharacterized membrane protein SirB2